MEFQWGSCSLQWYDSSSLLFSAPVRSLSHRLHPTIVYISPPRVSHLSFLPNLFLGCVWWLTHRAWLLYVSWTNRGHISLPGNTMPLWKCSVNYWPANKHPLCHFGLSYLDWDNGFNARLLSAQGHLFCVSWRNSAMCSRSAVSWIRAFLLEMKHFNANLLCHLPVERDDGLILSNFSVQTQHKYNCILAITPPSRYPI